MRLAEINRMDAAAFAAALGGIFEHSPWVAQRAWSRRPFGSLDALHGAMREALAEAGPEERLALVRAHPELAGREAAGGTLTADSSSEQGRLGFTSLSKQELARIAELNRRYRGKFGFPCIIALRLHRSRSSVMAEMERRLANDAGTELAAALEQIGHITRARLAQLVAQE